MKRFVRRWIDLGYRRSRAIAWRSDMSLRKWQAQSLRGSNDVYGRIVVVPSGVGTAWARRVPGHSLWLLYWFDVDVVSALAIASRTAPIE